MLEEEQLASPKAPRAAGGQSRQGAFAACAVPARGGPIGTFTPREDGELDGLLAQAGASRCPRSRRRTLLDRMLQRENEVQSELLDSVRQDTLLEWRLAIAALVGFPCLVCLALWALRERIFRPIGDLRAFLSRLSEGDFAPVSLPRIDPLLLPLFENYNQMVTRLEQLEQANRTAHPVARAGGARGDADPAAAAAEPGARRAPGGGRRGVRHAGARTAQPDRRNAGHARESAHGARTIPTLGERIDLVIAELQRITRLLNGLLQQSSHVPKPRRAGQRWIAWCRSSRR